MIVRDSSTCPHRRVLDHSILCELLHPDQVAGCGALSCSIAHAIVQSGETTLPHRLRVATELYYILCGTGRINIGGESRDLLAGQVVLIPPENVQYIENTGSFDLVFLCIVTPPWKEDDEELMP